MESSDIQHRPSVDWDVAADIAGGEAVLESLVRFGHVDVEQIGTHRMVRTERLLTWLRKRRDDEIQQRARDSIEGRSPSGPTMGYEAWPSEADEAFPDPEVAVAERRRPPAATALLPPGCHVQCLECPRRACPACPVLKEGN